MELIQQVGSIVGLASFLGLALMAFLYFAQAREVRRLQERAAFVPEDGADSPARAPAPASAATAASAETGEAGAPAPAAGDPRTAEQVEAARLAQLAREAAAERKQRFERRRRGEEPGGLPSLRGDRRSTIITAVGVLLLVAGLIFGATRLLGGDEEGAAPTAAKGDKSSDVGAPAAISLDSATVAVLNGTAEPGLAASVGDEVEDAGVSKLGAVTNTPTPFEVSTVMWEQGGDAAAKELADALGIGKTEPVTPEIAEVAGGAQLVVVVGDDRSSAAGSNDAGSL
jgi:hypothetical protein